VSERPQILWIGLGCRRGVSKVCLEAAIQKVCQAHCLAESLIIGLATLDRKADEAGIIELCQARQWQLRYFTAAQLAQVPLASASTVTQTKVGTPSVAEASALLATASLSLLVNKQVIQGPSSLETVTIAIAQAEPEGTR
jgi:cobalt-precorrin 5A hydrolase / precorrin-3B C17-methyltransferase